MTVFNRATYNGGKFPDFLPMHTESFIPGKDASLESTIATLQYRALERTVYRFELRFVERESPEIHRTRVNKVPLIRDVF